MRRSSREPRTEGSGSSAAAGCVQRADNAGSVPRAAGDESTAPGLEGDKSITVRTCAIPSHGVFLPSSGKKKSEFLLMNNQFVRLGKPRDTVIRRRGWLGG